MTPTDFDAFFQAIHKRAPFPWQSRLARQLCNTNAWPDLLDLPTGSGKTACIDIALFHWLVSASRGTPSHAARRIAFVVDRRIIVDEAADRAWQIAHRIQLADCDVLADARRVLEANSGGTAAPGDELIGVFTLRGGVARERNLVRDPLRVSVVLSTVDQIGSRILFRGYGVSDGMRPLHAGIFGTDTLLLLDEAHIADPFKQTLNAVVREQARAVSGPLGPKPLFWVQLSATPGEAANRARFALSDADRAHKLLSRRLQASKPMQLLEVPRRDDLSSKLVELVKTELELAPLSAEEKPRIGVIVNRVDTARTLHDALRKTLKAAVEVELLIGRVRPLIRDEYVARLSSKLKSSSVPREGTKPIVVVATQTIEVGADFDFHSLFTEAASYASIRQRVGRLNRLGIRDHARGAVVLVRNEAKDDVLYGNTIEATWQLLEGHARDGVVDLGISVAPQATPETEMRAPATPQLSPSLLSLLIQTNPQPAVEPDVAEFLHGFAAEVPDVAVVWRSGIAGQSEARCRELLRALPPLSLEAMTLPYSAFRQWTARWDRETPGRKFVDSGDVEGDPSAVDPEALEPVAAEVLLVTGTGVRFVSADKVHPGALVVVSAERGGADEYGWAPDDKRPVTDLALRVRLNAAGLDAPSEDPALHDRHSRCVHTWGQRHELVLVWTPEIAREWLRESGGESIEDVSAIIDDADTTRSDAAAELYEWLREHARALPSDVQRTLEHVSARKADWLEVGDDRFGLVLREGRPSGADLVEGRELQRTVPVLLVDHLRTVGELAESFARGAGLPDSLVTALKLAGATHDLGKADPRFQQRLRAPSGQLLAKNDSYDEDVPRGERHEVYSVAILDRYPELCAAVSEHRDLIRYLVGTHHGLGRAIHPVTNDAGIAFEVPYEGRVFTYTGRPALFAIDSGWADLFASQNRKYGPWMLAYLESIVRLADHRRSEQEIEEYVKSQRGHGRDE